MKHAASLLFLIIVSAWLVECGQKSRDPEALYKLLGVAKDATPREIKKAYHKLSLKYHPDHNPGDDAAKAKFVEINNAYEILSDEKKRQQYDMTGDTEPQPEGFPGGGFPGGFGFGGMPIKIEFTGPGGGRAGGGAGGGAGPFGNFFQTFFGGMGGGMGGGGMGGGMPRGGPHFQQQHQQQHHQQQHQRSPPPPPSPPPKAKPKNCRLVCHNDKCKRECS